MTTGAVTFINVIDVEPARQQELVEVLAEGTERVIRHRPGLISVTILASTDGTRVVNYARWRSADDVRATQQDPAAREYARRTAEVARADAKVYRVVSEYPA